MTRPQLVDRLLVALALGAAALAAAALLGVRIYTSVAGVRVSSQTAVRPTIIALAALLYWLYRSERRQQRVAAAWAWMLHHSTAVALVLTVSALVIALRISTFEATAADGYGYVSQAHLWASGDLTVDVPLAARVPWPEPEWTLAPLGYRPGPDRATIVPIYSPGLPLVMAGLLMIFGRIGPFLAVPALGAVAIFVIYRLGSRVAGPACGLLAAALSFTSAVFLFQLKEPMSDVPVTTWWLLAILLLTRPTPAACLLAGLSATAAIITRPNLVPLAALLAAYALVYPRLSTTARFRNAALFSAGVLPGCLAIAVLNTRLYGSPLASGYGSMSGLFSVDYFWTNLSRYPVWLLQSESPFVLLALVYFVLPRHSDARSWWERYHVPAMFVAFAAVLYACYALYLPFESWTFLRFLLPAIPLLLVLSSATALELSAKLRSPVARFAVAAMFVLFIAWRWDTTGLQPLKPLDRRFAVMGHFVRTRLPQNVVVFSMIHSGSVRYYADRLTLRWDWLPPEWLEPAAAFLAANGYRPVLLIEDWERPQYIERFNQHTTLGAIDWPPIATFRGNLRADVYDLEPGRPAHSQGQSHPIRIGAGPDALPTGY